MYRVFYLLVQCTLLLTGVGMAGMTFLLSLPDKALAWVLLCLLGGAAQFIGSRLNAVVRARARDVHYWQLKVLEAESRGQRPHFFSDFKLWQVQLRGLSGTGDLRADDDLSLSTLISSSEITRGFLDRTLPKSLGVVWLCLILASTGSLVMTTLSQYPI